MPRVPKTGPEKSYRVHGVVTISVSTVVRSATSEEDAKEQAAERMTAGLCYHCSRDSDEEWKPSSELDGEVEIDGARVIDKGYEPGDND